jgi:hypothetical protein
MKAGRTGSITLGALVAAAIALGCGEKSEPDATEPATPPASEQQPAGEDDSGQGAEGSSPTAAERRAARLRADQRAVERTVTRYIEALDARSGAKVCATLEPGALDGFKLPRQRGNCAASLDASIGYRDPRGIPAFEGVHLSEVGAIRVGRNSARATTSIVTNFSDRTEPSIEDDIIYLRRAEGGEWLIAKPSSALYRAIGAEPGPEVIVPPG